MHLSLSSQIYLRALTALTLRLAAMDPGRVSDMDRRLTAWLDNPHREAWLKRADNLVDCAGAAVLLVVACWPGVVGLAMLALDTPPSEALLCLILAAGIAVGVGSLIAVRAFRWAFQQRRVWDAWRRLEVEYQDCEATQRYLDAVKDVVLPGWMTPGEFFLVLALRHPDLHERQSQGRSKALERALTAQDRTTPPRRRL